MIPIKTPEEIQLMKKGGQILALILREIKEIAKPGIRTIELEEIAEKLILKYKGKCAFKGYQEGTQKSSPYPACLCTSVNEEIVHEIPSKRILKEGDILSIDLGIFFKPERFFPSLSKKEKEKIFPNLKNGFYLDAAITIPIGQISFEAQRLIRVTKKSLKLAIKKAKPGNTFGDIGNTIQRYVESQGFNVIKDLCGHGIGAKLHEEPKVLNYGKRHSGEKIKEGMVFCIEPMVSIGDWRIKRTKSGFGYETVDGSLSAHFEHTVAVTKDGVEVLTELK